MTGTAMISTAMTGVGAATRGRRTFRAAAVAVVGAGLVVAVPGVACADPVQVLAVAESVDQVLTNIRNWIVGLAAGLATVFLTIGGARYLIAGGDPSEVEKARAALRSAAFGYAFALLAPLLVEVLKGIVGE